MIEEFGLTLSVYGDVPKFFLTKGKNRLKNWPQSSARVVWIQQGYNSKGLLLVVGLQEV